MIFICEGCRRRTELFHCRSVDEYLCEDCIAVLGDEENQDEYDDEECA